MRVNSLPYHQLCASGGPRSFEDIDAVIDDHLRDSKECMPTAAPGTQQYYADARSWKELGTLMILWAKDVES